MKDLDITSITYEIDKDDENFVSLYFFDAVIMKVHRDSIKNVIENLRGIEKQILLEETKKQYLESKKLT